MLLRYEYFCTYTPILQSRIMGCHENHGISYHQRIFIFKDNIFLHLCGPNEQIYTHNEMSFVFNLGLITPLHTIVYPCFSLILNIY